MFKKVKIANRFVFVLLFGGCITKGAGEREKKSEFINMQVYVDSCTRLYKAAIDEMKQGANKDSVSKKYSDRVVFVHSEFKKTFDSVTSAYVNKRLAQEEYDKIRESIILDSVRKKSEELSQLGINIKLR